MRCRLAPPWVTWRCADSPRDMPRCAGILDQWLAGGGGSHSAGFQDSAPLDGGQYPHGRPLGRGRRPGRSHRRFMAGQRAVDRPADCRALAWRRSVAAKGLGPRLRGTSPCGAQAPAFVDPVVDHDGSLRRQKRRGGSRPIRSGRSRHRQVAASSAGESSRTGDAVHRAHR